jgi:16S rRNA (cytosine1402-N4)-methyltransferase
MGLYHIPVLLKESIASLAIKPGGIYIDATFGGGGHSRAILEQLGPEGRLLVFDQDPDSHNNLPDDRRITWIQSNFRFIHNFCKHHGVMKADGILADLGVSWHQFDTMERGFSFRFDAPLDMRMNRVSEKTAARS